MISQYFMESLPFSSPDAICLCWRAVRPRNQSITIEGRPYFPCAVLGRIDAGAHGGKLVIHAEEASNLWQNLVGTVDEVLEADAQCVDSQIGAPALSMPFL